MNPNTTTLTRRMALGAIAGTALLAACGHLSSAEAPAAVKLTPSGEAS